MLKTINTFDCVRHGLFHQAIDSLHLTLAQIIDTLFTQQTLLVSGTRYGNALRACRIRCKVSVAREVSEQLRQGSARIRARPYVQDIVARSKIDTRSTAAHLLVQSQ